MYLASCTNAETLSEWHCFGLRKIFIDKIFVLAHCKRMLPHHQISDYCHSRDFQGPSVFEPSPYDLTLPLFFIIKVTTSQVLQLIWL